MVARCSFRHVYPLETLFHTAGEWNGKTSNEDAACIRDGAHSPLGKYEELVSLFNPEKFNADEWATMAKNAGMKYKVNLL